MVEVRTTSKAESAWSRARRVLTPSPRVACAGSFVLGGWSVVHAAQIVASTAVVSTFALPMAIGALFGAILSGLRELASVRPTGDVDWVERIRVGVLAISAYSPLYRFFRGYPTTSTWCAFFGGAFVMYALVLVLQLLKGPSSTQLKQPAADT